MAIIEYLDETRPEPALLPKDPKGRARVRALAQIVACDGQPRSIHAFKPDPIGSSKLCGLMEKL